MIKLKDILEEAVDDSGGGKFLHSTTPVDDLRIRFDLENEDEDE